MTARRSWPLLFLFFLQVLAVPAMSQDSVPADFCISEEDVRLYDLINEYRKAMTLTPIPLSRSLSYVAKKHALDLDANKPDTNTCNFHSWSDKGTWQACCYEKDVKDRTCMTSKPGELTNYPGYGYEIVYWENKSANADKAFNQWREASASRSLLTNFKEWENYQWNAVGVAIYKNFAIAWFGEERLEEGGVKVCGTNRLIQDKIAESTEIQRIISSESGRFYVIVGSFNSLEDAKSQLNNFIQEGFKKARVVTKDNKYRISLSDYATMEQASAAKKELPAKYKGAWVLAF